jgi:hypothetical protein
MFAGSRYVVIASLPDNLTEREMKEAIFIRTYGVPLPADFFGKPE